MKAYIIESCGVFLVRAENEELALKIANKNGADNYYTCRELDLTKEGLIFSSYHKSRKIAWGE